MKTELEWILTNSYKADMISYLRTHPESFEEAIKLAIADNQPYSWRAAWLLWSCMDKNDLRIQEYIEDIINILAERNDNLQRELLKILQQMEINEELEGLLFNHCVNVWEKTDKKPSVRFNAFTTIVKIAQKHPDLYTELILLTQNKYTNSLSETVKKSISEMIKKI